MYVPLDPSPHPLEHPFSEYVALLRENTSVSWFSRTGTVHEIRDYVWGVMRLRYENSRHHDNGFARTSADTVLFAGVASEDGAALTCFPIDDIGVDRINHAIADEQEAMREACMAGTWVGNGPQTHLALVKAGGVDVNETGFFGIVNGGRIVSLV